MDVDALPASEEKRTSVRAMFDRIAPRYDGMNRLLTGGLDQRWRRIAVETIHIGRGDRVLDLACGTGDLAELCARRGATVLGADFALEMLRGAQRRQVQAAIVQADGAALPFRSESFDKIVCGFALRNFVALPEIFAELARVCAVGAKIALLDVDRPRASVLRAGHSLYFDRVVPAVGGLLGDRDAYRYLPQSTTYLPPEPELCRLVGEAGFERVTHRPLFFGSVQLVTADRSTT